MIWKSKDARASAKKAARTTALLGIVAAAATAVTGAASAQTAAPAAPAASTSGDEEIVVTGTRIRGVTNANSPSPISVQTADEISQTKALTLEDVLQRMVGPDATAGITTNTNNGGVGLSAIGMRNLGPSRTLVLVDGQRLVPVFVGASAVPDLNTIPVSMVDRIEVLRDGASSIYGADAVGGVINIITNRSQSGLHLEGSTGISGQGDTPSYSLAATFGLNSDRGNVSVSLSTDHQSELGQWERDWGVATHIGEPAEGGSNWRSQLDVLQDENSTAAWVNGALTSVTNPALATQAPCLAFLPALGSVKLNSGCELGWNNLVSSQTRHQISVNSHYDILPNLTFIMQGFFTERQSGQALRPEPLLGDSISSVINGTPVYAGFQVPRSWPGMAVGGTTKLPADGTGCADPTGCVQAFLTPVQFGPRTYRQLSDSYRIRFGFEGTIADHWDWEVGYVNQRNQDTRKVYNTGQFQHLAQITGQENCVDVPGGCVAAPAGWAANGVTRIPAVLPNFTNGPNMFTAAQAAYLKYTSVDSTHASENYYYGDINGSLFTLPAGELRAAFGFERRKEFAQDEPDIINQIGYGPSPANPTAGGYDVTSYYVEFNIPVLADLPLFQNLTLTPSYRWDHYNTFGDARTWKVGLDWRLIEDLRLRGSINTGFRAPSTAELFGGQAISFIAAGGDPCDNRAPAAAANNENSGTGLRTAGSTCAAAVNGGAAYTTFNPPQNSIFHNQIPLLVGGNPNLQPETSRSWTFGANLTPRFLPGFEVTADYYQVKISNSILTGGVAQSAGPDLVLEGCYGPDQNAAFCSLITRNAAHNITQVLSLNTNFGEVVVHGLDMEVGWDSSNAHVDLPIPGSINVRVEASRQFTNTQENPDGTVTEFNGTFNAANESFQPKWKGQINVNYSLDALTFHWDSRFSSATDNVAGGGHVQGNFLPDYWVHDLAVSYDLPQGDVLTGGRLTFGVNNVLDRDPPFLSKDTICKCNSLAGPYDFIGRFFFVRASANF